MKNALIVVLTALCLQAHAQQFPELKYPQHYFQNPLPVPMVLAGGFGELRPGHFHSGLDIKTDGHIGMPVHAAQEGYISRVSVSSTGFGNAIYITHPNGYTTLYGHLSRFNPALAAYVEKEEYARKSWAIDLTLPEHLFPVKKGQFIAWSGDTGNSGGPHVHFEIRNTRTQDPLNEFLFGFPIKDHTAPKLYRLAVYDRGRSIYEQAPHIYTLKHVGPNRYAVSPHVLAIAADSIGFGLQALDFQDNTHNNFGIYEELVYKDGVLQNGFRLNDIGYNVTRYVDAHEDYKTFRDHGIKFELLFSLPGNHLPIYYNFHGNGTIDLQDGKPHTIRIEARDPNGNTSVVVFSVQRRQEGAAHPVVECSNRMIPNIRNILDRSEASFYLKPDALYDTLCLDYGIRALESPVRYSDWVQIGNPDIPLYSSYELHLKLHRPVPNNWISKAVIVRDGLKGKFRQAVPARITGGWAAAPFEKFGLFSVQIDTVAPVLVPLGFRNGQHETGARRLAFKAEDALSGLASFNAYLDNSWLMFARVHNTFYYLFDRHCRPGMHTLKVIATDEVGNTTTHIYHFKR